METWNVSLYGCHHYLILKIRKQASPSGGVNDWGQEKPTTYLVANPQDEGDWKWSITKNAYA